MLLFVDDSLLFKNRGSILVRLVQPVTSWFRMSPRRSLRAQIPSLAACWGRERSRPCLSSVAAAS